MQTLKKAKQQIQGVIMKLQKITIIGAASKNYNKHEVQLEYTSTEDIELGAIVDAQTTANKLAQKGLEQLIGLVGVEPQKQAVGQTSSQGQSPLTDKMKWALKNKANKTDAEISNMSFADAKTILDAVYGGR